LKIYMKAERPWNKCFGCGPDNPIGLRLEFTLEGDLFWSRYTPPPHFQGYNGILHGGIIATMLDEVMANHVLALGHHGIVTAELTVRYVQPVPIGIPLKIVSRLMGERRRLFQMEGWLEDDTGEVLARGSAKMMMTEMERKEAR